MKSDMNKRQPKATDNRKTTTRKPSTASAKRSAAKPTVKKTKTVAVKPTKPPKTISKPTKSVTKAPQKARKETLVSLRGHVDDIVKRLKNADSLTRRSVKSLETAFGVLENEVKNHKTINHAALTRRVDQLASQLQRNIETTKSEIATDLKAALDNPTITGLQAAIGKSEMRLSQTEIAQSQALAKINRHIAELARVIDSRLKENTQKITTLQDHVTTVEAKNEQRVIAVEQATATAVRRLGDNVVSAAEQYQSKLDQQNALMREKIAEIGVQTSKDFNSFKTETSRRLETLEHGQQDQNHFMDQAITKLASRIDNLEYGLSDPAIPVPVPHMAPSEFTEPTPVAPVQEHIAEDPFQVADQGVPVSTQYIAETVAPQIQQPIHTPAEELNPYISLVPDLAQEPAYAPLEDAYSPQPISAPVATPVEPVQNYAETTYELGQPQEFQPQPAEPLMAQQHHYVDPAQANYAPQAQAGNAAYAYAEQEPAYDYAQTAAPNTDGPLEFVPAQEFAQDELPYADPGYGEQHQAQVATQGVSRPGHVESLAEKKSRMRGLKDGTALSNIPGLTPRNLKVAGLAIIIASAGYFGLRSFSGNSNPAPISVDKSISSDMGIMPVGSSIESLAPIGEYDDNQGGVIDPAIPDMASAPGGTQTLAQAAEGGDAIAQFQLGLYYLDAGRSNDGLKFIRASANQGQPAAQYRLGKLYEAGIGVKADPDMARQLTERAARAGNRIAMHDLGLYYADGLGGVDRNIETALSWFEKAAERGVVDSQYNLGVLFESSPEVPRDALTSFVWYSIAASQGDQVAASRRPILEKDLSAEQLDQAKRRLAQFKPTAIDDAANGIFRQINWTMPEGQKLAAAPELVRDVQFLLGQLGYNVGTPDGDAGPKTKAAVLAFEKANGMTETGIVSASLIDRLQAAAGV